MSSQKGNTKRVRPQKHKNSTVFRNDKYDKSKRTERINKLEVAEVCKRCQDVIAWKIKYKKYKLLSQPKTCTKCHGRKIKDAYHVICLDCAKALDICCKCGKKEEIVAHFSPSEKERIQTMQQLEVEVKALSERKRRAYQRYMDKISGKKKKKRKQPMSETPQEGTEEGTEVNNDTEKTDGDEEKVIAPLSLDEYFKTARSKLEELQKQMDENMFDDFDELDICGSSEDEDCENEDDCDDADAADDADDDDADDEDTESDCERTAEN